MAPVAKARFARQSRWAKAAGLPKETLSRLKTQNSFDLRTLAALAQRAGYRLAAIPVATGQEGAPERFDRDYEDKLLDLAASGSLDPGAWRALGEFAPWRVHAWSVCALAEAFAGEGVPVSSNGEAAKRRRLKDRVQPQDGYRAAFAELLARVQHSLKEDIDATFSKKVLLADDIQVSYRDADGRARLLYLDRNDNDTLGLLHEDAYKDSRPVEVTGVDKNVIDVRVLSPVDLAVSKLARFTDQDREDIQLVARRRLIDSDGIRKRAEEALAGYVGDASPVRTSIEIACRLIEAGRDSKHKKAPSRRPRDRLR